MQMDVYVNYRGNCEEAFRYYEQHLGGPTFFANRFAMLRDRFGASWMLLHEPAAG